MRLSSRPRERFWCAREGAFALDAAGYLADPSATFSGNANPNIVSSVDLLTDRCLVLLGEPGAGKSTVLLEAWKQVEKDLNYTIVSFGTEMLQLCQSTGLVKDRYDENVKDPRYKVLAKAGLITIGKAKGEETPVDLTPKGEELLNQHQDVVVAIMAKSNQLGTGFLMAAGDMNGDSCTDFAIGNDLSKSVTLILSLPGSELCSP